MNKLLLRHPLKLGEDHKYGYCIVDSAGEVLRIIDRTNPSARWDWHVIGGRYGNFLRLKPGRVGISFRLDQLRDELESSKRICSMFRDGPGPGNIQHQEQLAAQIAALAGNGGAPPYASASAAASTAILASTKVQYADIAFKGDVDVEAMRDEAEVNARADYAKFQRLVDGLPRAEQWKAVLARHDGAIDKARDEYHAQPAIKAMWSDADLKWEDYEDYDMPLDDYIQRARAGAFRAVAVVKDQTWFERGKMGWFGCASNEISMTEWDTQFAVLLDDLPNSAVICIVDCHI